MFLAPKPRISEADLRCGLRWLMADAGFATAVGALNSGVVLVAYALWLGAPNTVIGLLAALPFWTQFLQAPAVSLVERLRARRLISVLALFTARLALPLMALLPVISDKHLALALLVAGETVHCSLNAVGACAWNSWIRDLVPERRLGVFFARRSIWAALIGVAGNLVAGLALQSQHASQGRGDGLVFTALYGAGFLASLVSTLSLARVPEPQMETAQPRQTLVSLLSAPLKDANFVRLIRFLVSWQFAVNLATPFFTVFFVQQLGLGMAHVMGFTIVSQAANILVLQTWGRLTDRFSNKTVLDVAAPGFLLCIAAMAWASSIHDRAVLMAYLAVLHFGMGVASAGVSLACGNIALKLAPRGSATAYVAANALLTSAAGGAAPVLGGMFADFFARRALTFQVLWKNPHGVRAFTPVQFTHWDFYFVLAAALGLYALHRLAFVHEAGVRHRQEMVQEVLSGARRSIRNLSPVAGLQQLAAAFPGGQLLEAHGRLRQQRRARRARLKREEKLVA
jgi:MFS family permease